ncbi:MAG: lactate 2-monooxygenase [bacterium]
MSEFGRKRQSDIYVKGLAGTYPAVPIDMEALERAAREVMSPEAFAYVAGGAGIESTVRENRESFERWRIVPKMLKDVSVRDTSVELFGRKLDSPIMLAPIGVQEMAHDDADLATAKACASEGVPMIFSNQASVSMEECAAVMGQSPRWFQLYWSKSNDLVASLVERAEACGCEAICVTLDTTLLGWRIRDLDLAYLPFLRGKGIAQYTSDPVFQKLLDIKPEGGELDEKRTVNLNTLKVFAQLMTNYPDDLLTNVRSGKPLAAVRQFIGIYTRPSLTWEDLPFLREHTKLPILLKGVQHPDDAQRAKDEGIDGLIVSNHGGRQVDGAIGSLDALKAIVEKVGPDYPIVFDSGIRSGADIYKALALGARAACIGRPYIWGLALAGEEGVREVLQNFRADFDLTMGLAGARSVAEITPDTLVRQG